MAGNQSRGLIAASKTRGWDPTVIPARDDKPAVSISNFDMDQTNAVGSVDPLGRLPEGKVISYPDGYSHPPTYSGADGISPPATTFNYPDVTRENKSRRTTNANPTPAEPGA